MNYFKFLSWCILITLISGNLFAQNNDVTLKWKANRTVIHIGGELYPVQASSERTITLPVDDVLTVAVDTP